MLPAAPHILSEARYSLRRWLRHGGATDAESAEITMAVSEACTNAVEHAYSPAPAAFTLAARRSGDEVVITVRDGGQWRPPRGSNRGRGLTIIKAAMDAVQINTTAKGTEITMQRRLRG